MIIVNIIGGLGNQMFQYAFGYAMAQRMQTELKLDIHKLDTRIVIEGYTLREYGLGLYHITNKVASFDEVVMLMYQEETLLQKIARKLARKQRAYSASCYPECSSHFDENILHLHGNFYFIGYWQNEKYFREYSQDIRNIFTLKKSIQQTTEQYKQLIINCNSVGVHIRRGDYVTNPHTNSVHGTCDLAYYRNAVALIQEKSADPHFFIFSDDLEWVKANFDFIEQKTFVELDEAAPDHEEMYLMSQCQHNIIANSSFSWWGAWLNQNPQKIVIAPKKWFRDQTRNTKDIIPETWIRLGTPSKEFEK